MSNAIAATRRGDGLVDECWDCGKTTEYECPHCSVPVCQDCAAGGDHAENCG